MFVGPRIVPEHSKSCRKVGKSRPLSKSRSEITWWCESWTRYGGAREMLAWSWSGSFRRVRSWSL